MKIRITTVDNSLYSQLQKDLNKKKKREKKYIPVELFYMGEASCTKIISAEEKHLEIASCNKTRKSKNSNKKFSLYN